MLSESTIIKTIHGQSDSLLKIFNESPHITEQALAIIDASEAQIKGEAQAKYSAIRTSILEKYQGDFERVNALLNDLDNRYGSPEQGWDGKDWIHFRPCTQTSPQYLTRVGTLTPPCLYDTVSFPALLPIIGKSNIIFKASGAGKERVRNVLQALTLRLMVGLPAGKLRLVCIDPIGLGSTMAGFIKGLPDSTTGGQAWFSQQDIEQKLVDLENHMAFVKQKYLGVRFGSMEEYNALAGQVEEPYRLLVISDFPARFTDSAAQHLLSIATNGPGTGVHLIAMVDQDQKLPFGFNLADLERTAILLESDANGDRWLDRDFQNCTLTLDSPPPPEDFEQMLQQVREATIAASDIQVPFTTALPEKAEWWKGNSRSNVRIPVGQFGARETQYFNLDEKLLSSALIVGKTGSGKSTLLHIIINGLASMYAPDEVELYLLDFKQVEFKDYAIHRLPHARVVAVKSEREFGLSVLRGLDGVLQRRKDRFGNITSLSDYRNKTNERLPRMVLLADEFQELFSYDDAISNELSLILDRIIRQGRAFGINVILASQTLSGANSISTATKNQIPIRIALQCSDADSRQVLSDENDRARLLERSGEAIYNSANGLVEGNNRFQVFWMDDRDRQDLLKSFREIADRDPFYQQRSPIIFDGESPAKIENNSQLTSILNEPVWPKIKRGWATSAWVGEPIEIKAHTSVMFRRQSRSNLLIIGQGEYEEEAVSLMLSTLISLSTQLNPRYAKFEVLNLTDVDLPWHEAPSTVARLLPHEVNVVKRRGLQECLAGLNTELGKRLANDEIIYKSPAIYLMVIGLHRARELRQDDEPAPYSFDHDDAAEPAISPSKLLKTLIREGPDAGIHTLLWSDTWNNFQRAFQDREIIGEFEYRIGFQMGADDSRSLFDSEIATRIGADRCLLFCEEQANRLEKFRPYSLPEMDWLKKLGATLAKRQDL